MRPKHWLCAATLCFSAAAGEAALRPPLLRAVAPALTRDGTLAAPASVPLWRLRGGDAAAAPNLGWLSLIPPVVALSASVALRQVILALLLGVWSGALLVHRGNGLLAAARTFDSYFVDALAEREHAGVVLFTLLLGGTIGLVQKAGGGLALAALLRRFMTSARSGLGACGALCSLIFFDDYSSVLIVGTSMREAIAALGVPSERLALLVHTMGVVLASVSPAGLQIGYVGALLKQIGAVDDPFLAAVSSVRYRFFPLLALAALPLSILLQKDLGPLGRPEFKPRQPRSSPRRTAERRAQGQGEGRAEGQGEGAVAEGGPGPLDPKAGTPLRAVNALLPFGTIVLATFGGMLADGAAKVRSLPDASRPPLSLVSILSHSDSITALIWASAAGWLSALGLVLAQGALALDEAMAAWAEGLKEVLEPMLVLLLAWALGAVIADVGTATFLARSLREGLPRWSLPPIALGGGSREYLLHCIGSCLGGATFGNICSPISDTTILTAPAAEVLASRCDLQAHVATITPYALLAAATALLFGSVPVGLGLYGPLAALAVGVAAMGAAIAVFGT
ncbi:hypothetical protein EMIHUDRAFT_466337 [Emiliania huxleyi CCMP1516]|uniref:Na+/H+ antiporter NhaC-like C-terminal domain-containing protein n=2 Tax=Emiliania huxleyi TaxID=2903 RepID=A0A0D3HXE7_EMIH1|nr:hypothetical protein EMIHUDRAFT_466337 [Emiliania huxleyi CCMP1516]EOD03682.1 hypothetical protein EMIHUDRAFT_466337 [Emiliania huxleyi CCMP1516]|eukprot:XP_005756111.1 hypothetical protein EMIHUDRAFT_466337 [Emiliania huxleyi CCMP1516]